MQKSDMTYTLSVPCVSLLCTIISLSSTPLPTALLVSPSQSSPTISPFGSTPSWSSILGYILFTVGTPNGLDVKGV